MDLHLGSATKEVDAENHPVGDVVLSFCWMPVLSRGCLCVCVCMCVHVHVLIWNASLSCLDSTRKIFAEVTKISPHNSFRATKSNFRPHGRPVQAPSLAVSFLTAALLKGAVPFGWEKRGTGQGERGITPSHQSQDIVSKTCKDIPKFCDPAVMPVWPRPGWPAAARLC